MSRSRHIEDILRRAALASAEAKAKADREAMFLATMRGVSQAAQHGIAGRRDESELVHYHPSHEGERGLKTSWPRSEQRVVPGKHVIPVRGVRPPNPVNRMRRPVDERPDRRIISVIQEK